MPFPTTQQIVERNQQYRKLEMSRNKKKEYRLEIFTLEDGWAFSMLNTNRSYLITTGDNWYTLGMIEDYKITEV